MSHEYPPLPEPAQGADDVFYIEDKDLFTADQLHAYAAPLLERIAELEGAVAAERERWRSLITRIDVSISGCRANALRVREWEEDMDAVQQMLRDELRA